MKTVIHTVQDGMGLHARPVGQIVKMLKPFASAVNVSCEGKACDMKKLIALMSLGIQQGQTMKITIEGEDEEACADAMMAFLVEAKV